MKIKMLTTAAGPGGIFQAGQVIDVPDPLAGAFIAGGYAMAMEPITPIPEPEIATVEPREWAVPLRGKAKKKK